MISNDMLEETNTSKVSQKSNDTINISKHRFNLKPNTKSQMTSVLVNDILFLCIEVTEALI